MCERMNERDRKIKEDKAHNSLPILSFIFNFNKQIITFPKDPYNMWQPLGH